MYKRWLILLVLLVSWNVNGQIITTVFGDVDEENALILQLLESKAMQRLKHIDQSGPEAYFTENFPRFSRYEHSLGVYALLKKFQVSETELMAGLLHDASHTVFSHLADVIFQTGEMRKESYQDNIHDWFLGQMNIDKIIAAANLSLTDISPKNPKFLALEQPYPDMNADRIEYNLHTGLVFDDLSQDDVQQILNSLRFANNKWYFTDFRQAKKFAKLSTYYTKSFWGSAHNAALYIVCGAAIKYAFSQQLISKNEMHFGIDADIVNILSNSTDPVLNQLVTIMRDIDKYYSETDRSDYDSYQPVKMRGIDPLVMRADKLQRLSSMSIDFQHDLLNTAQLAKRGLYIKFKNISNEKVLALLKAN
jgi:hypothetical protein